jgi:hypothetical protein
MCCLSVESSCDYGGFRSWEVGKVEDVRRGGGAG